VNFQDRTIENRAIPKDNYATRSTNGGGESKSIKSFWAETRNKRVIKRLTFGFL
jgi:hypothetical protein